MTKRLARTASAICRPRSDNRRKRFSSSSTKPFCLSDLSVIEALPRDNTVRDRYGYDKSVVFVRQDIFLAVRAVHWVHDGGKLKYLDLKRLEQIDGIWMGTELDMKTTKGGETLHRTVMRFSDVKFNQPLDESLFTVRRLEKGP